MLKLFIPETYICDISTLYQGTPISNYYHIKALSKLAQLYVIYKEDKQLDENIYGLHITPYTSVQFLKQLFDKEKFDGVLVLTPDFKWVSLIRAVSDIPLIMRVHAVRGSSNRLNNILACYSILKEGDIIAPVSRWAARYLSSFIYDHERCIFPILNGVDVEFFKPMDKIEAKKKVSEMLGDERIMDRVVVGFLSRFQPEKGALAFLKVARMNPDLLFLAVGSVRGDYSEWMSENVLLVGLQRRELLPLFYNSFDVYCFPSLIGTESFGMTVLEAMACGVPPIVTDFDGVPEVVGDTGLTVSAVDDDEGLCGLTASISAEELSQKIRLLAEDEEERLRRGELARRRSLEFSWDNIAKRIVDLFQELISRARLVRRRKSKPYLVRFIHQYDAKAGRMETECALYNIRDGQTGALRNPASVPFLIEFEEGLCLTLLRHHTEKEVFAVLRRITGDKIRAQEVIVRVNRFLDSIP